MAVMDKYGCTAPIIHPQKTFIHNGKVKEFPVGNITQKLPVPVEIDKPEYDPLFHFLPVCEKGSIKPFPHSAFLIDQQYGFFNFNKGIPIPVPVIESLHVNVGVQVCTLLCND